MNDTITITELARLSGRNRSAIARKVQRARLRVQFETADKPGSPERHYRTAEIMALLIDRRYGPRAGKGHPHAATATPPLS